MNNINDSLLELLEINEDDQDISLQNIDRVTNQNETRKNNISSFCVESPINTVCTPCGHHTVCLESYCHVEKKL